MFIDAANTEIRSGYRKCDDFRGLSGARSEACLSDAFSTLRLHTKFSSFSFRHYYPGVLESFTKRNFIWFTSFRDVALYLYKLPFALFVPLHFHFLVKWLACWYQHMCLEARLELVTFCKQQPMLNATEEQKPGRDDLELRCRPNAYFYYLGLSKTRFYLALTQLFKENRSVCILSFFSFTVHTYYSVFQQVLDEKT